MAKKKKKSKLAKRWERFIRPYRIVVINPFTFEEKREWELTKGRLFVYGVFYTFMIAIAVTLLIFYTPLKTFVPGYPNPNVTQKIKRLDRQNLLQIDELLAELERKDNYINNILSVLKGEIETLSTDSAEVRRTKTRINFPTSEKDSILRAKVEAEEKINIRSTRAYENKGGISSPSFAHVVFFKPIEGRLTNKFSQKEGHLGIDIIAPSDEPVKATLEGTVVFSSWTPDNGYVMQIQHPNNLISVYKHNAVLLKSVGEYVTAGEPIAFIGNTGELSEGPHLHFELWRSGTPINPENYLKFDAE